MVLIKRQMRPWDGNRVISFNNTDLHKKCEVRREKDRVNTCQREGDREQEFQLLAGTRICKVPTNPTILSSRSCMDSRSISTAAFCWAGPGQAQGSRGCKALSTGSAASSLWWMFCVQNKSANGEKRLCSTFTATASLGRSSCCSLPMLNSHCLSTPARIPGHAQPWSGAVVALLSRPHSPAAKAFPAQFSLSWAQCATLVCLGRAGTALPCRSSWELSHWG